MPTRYRGSAREVRALDVFIKLSRAVDAVGQVLHARLADAGLTHGQLAVLEALLHGGAMCQRDLGRKLLRSGSNVTTVIDNLERDGLVERRRQASDRRLVDVALTARGRRLIEKVFPAHARSVADCFAALGVEEQEELARLCKKLGYGAMSLHQEMSDDE